ncbi:MAG: WD40 repeat domain-containing protein [bacterium]
MVPLVIGGAVLTLALALMGGILGWAVNGDSSPAENENRIAAADNEAPDTDKAPDTDSTEPSSNNSAERPQPELSFQYMPANADLIAKVRVGELWNSTWLKSLKASPESQGTLEQLETTLTQIGLPPSEIASLQVGVGQLPQAAMPSMATSAMLAAGNVSVVVRSEQDIDPEKMLQLIRRQLPPETETTTATHQGTTYYQVPMMASPVQSTLPGQPAAISQPDPAENDQATKTIAAFLGDQRTLVLCPGEQVKTYIERGEQSALPKNFQFIESKQHALMASAQHVLLAFAPVDPAQLSKLLPLNNLRALLLGLRSFENLNWQWRACCADQNSAKEAARAVTSQLQAARNQVDAWKEKPSHQQFASAWKLIGEVLTNARIGRTGSVVDVTGSVTTSEPETLSLVPPALMSTFAVPGTPEMAAGQPSNGDGQLGQTQQEQPASPSSAPPSSEPGDQPSTSQQSPSQPAAEAKQAKLKTTLNLTYEQPFGVLAPEDQESLYATLHLTGQAAADTTHYGFLKLTKCQRNNGESLKQLESSFSMNDPSEQFVEIDRDMMFAGEFNAPKNQLRLHVVLEKPPAGASQLKAIEGYLDLLASNEQKQITLKKVSGKAGQKLANPVLQEAGLEIRVLKPTNERTRLFSENPEQSLSLEIDGQRTALLDFQLQDQNGKTIETQTAWSEGSSDEPAYYSLQAEQKLPATTALQLTAAVDQKRLRVPFRFENVSLPEKGGTTTAEAVSDVANSPSEKSVTRRDQDPDDPSEQKSATGDALFQPADPRTWNENQPSTNELLFYSIQSIAFSPDGQLLASTGNGGKIRLWDLHTAQPRAVCTGHEGTVQAIDFSPDGTLLASVGSDQTVRLWKTQTGEQLRLLGRHWSEAFALNFSPDGSTLATGGRDWTVRLWDVDSGEPLGMLKGHVGWVRAVAFSPDGQLLASAAPRRPNRDNGGEIIVWDVNSEVPDKITYGMHENVDITSRKIYKKMAEDSGAESLAFLPNGKQVLAASALEEAVCLWDLESVKPLRQWESRTGPIGLSLDGKLLALCKQDGTTQLRNLDTNELLLQWQPHKEGVHSLSFSPDETMLATAGAKRGVRVWKVPTE